MNNMTNSGRQFMERHSGSKIIIRRDQISQDGFDKLQNVDLKAPISITFIDRFGQEE